MVEITEEPAVEFLLVLRSVGLAEMHEGAQSLSRLPYPRSSKHPQICCSAAS